MTSRVTQSARQQAYRGEPARVLSFSLGALEAIQHGRPREALMLLRDVGVVREEPRSAQLVDARAVVEAVQTARPPKERRTKNEGRPGYRAIEHKAFSYTTKAGKVVKVKGHTEWVKGA